MVIVVHGYIREVRIICTGTTDQVNVFIPSFNFREFSASPLLSCDCGDARLIETFRSTIVSPFLACLRTLRVCTHGKQPRLKRQWPCILWISHAFNRLATAGCTADESCWDSSGIAGIDSTEIWLGSFNASANSSTAMSCSIEGSTWTTLPSTSRYLTSPSPSPGYWKNCGAAGISLVRDSLNLELSSNFLLDPIPKTKAPSVSGCESTSVSDGILDWRSCDWQCS